MQSVGTRGLWESKAIDSITCPTHNPFVLFFFLLSSMFWICGVLLFCRKAIADLFMYALESVMTAQGRREVRDRKSAREKMWTLPTTADVLCWEMPGGTGGVKKWG
ncbi:hypothetical protein BDZ91DRAFT_723436 [Kalaharituber pfeilii]|nr:hypothetical protein BDZ91DRAFT_723436 [Kalaharituber pfeilii]